MSFSACLVRSSLPILVLGAIAFTPSTAPAQQPKRCSRVVRLDVGASIAGQVQAKDCRYDGITYDLYEFDVKEDTPVSIRLVSLDMKDPEIALFDGRGFKEKHTVATDDGRYPEIDEELKKGKYRLLVGGGKVGDVYRLHLIPPDARGLGTCMLTDAFPVSAGSNQRGLLGADVCLPGNDDEGVATIKRLTLTEERDVVVSFAHGKDEIGLRLLDAGGRVISSLTSRRHLSKLDGTLRLATILPAGTHYLIFSKVHYPSTPYEFSIAIAEQPPASARRAPAAAADRKCVNHGDGLLTDAAEEVQLGREFEGRLAPGWCTYWTTTGATRTYLLDLKRWQKKVTIEAKTPTAHAQLTLRDIDKKVLAQAPSFGGGRAAQIVRELPAGKYLVSVTGMSMEETGSYSLLLAGDDAPAAPVAAEKRTAAATADVTAVTGPPVAADQRPIDSTLANCMAAASSETLYSGVEKSGNLGEVDCAGRPNGRMAYYRLVLTKGSGVELLVRRTAGTFIPDAEVFDDRGRSVMDLESESGTGVSHAFGLDAGTYYVAIRSRNPGEGGSFKVFVNAKPRSP